MATTYADIQAKISQLQAQAQSVRAKEVSEVVSRIKQEIATYGLTADDLGLTGGTKLKSAKRAVKGAGVPKYRDPASGKTWTGHGKAPAWLANKDRSAFLIDAAPTTEAVAAKPATPAKQALNGAVKKALKGSTATAKKTAKPASGARKGAGSRATA